MMGNNQKMNGKDNIQKDKSVIDVLKLFFAISVVSVHTGLLAPLDERVSWYIMKLICRMAVPFFFCASGYFLAKKLRNAQNKKIVWQNYRKRLILPFLVWTGVCTVIYIISRIAAGDGMLWLGAKVVRSFVFYPKGAMWFVGACILASFVIEKFLEKKWTAGLAVWGIIGYTFALFANSYFWLIEHTIAAPVMELYLKIGVSAMNGVLVGIPMLGAGMAVEKLEGMANWKVIIGFVAVALVYLFEVYICYGKNCTDDGAIFFSTIIFSQMLFLLALNMKEIRLPLPFREMRELSTSLYFMHSFLNELISGLFGEHVVAKFIFVVAVITGFYTVVVRRLPAKYKRIFC